MTTTGACWDLLVPAQQGCDRSATHGGGGRHRDISISQTGRRDERLVSAKIFVRGIDPQGQARMIAGPQCEVSRSLRCDQPPPRTLCSYLEGSPTDASSSGCIASVA